LGYYRNISPEERKQLNSFRNDESWSQWAKTLHPLTLKTYESVFFTFLKGMKLTPTQLRDRADKDPRETSKLVKLRFAELEKEGKSKAVREVSKSALKSFLAFHEIVLPLIGLKLNGTKRRKPFMSWEDAQRIVGLANVEYQPVFKFMLWSAMDVARFTDLNRDQDRLGEVKRQLRDQSQDWIKIEVPEGRKHSPAFFVMVPRDIAGLLPILEQSGKPITSKQNIHHNWVVARNRAGFSELTRIGPHNLRSVWISEAARRKLDPIICEHQLGHIVDKLNYQRLQDEEDWVLGEFREAWATNPAASRKDTEDLRNENIELKARIKKLEATSPEQLEKLVTPALVEKWVGAYMAKHGFQPKTP
jgi:integrase